MAAATHDGRMFHTRASSAGKAQSPTVEGPIYVHRIVGVSDEADLMTTAGCCVSSAMKC